MDYKLEAIILPVTDVDRAKAFYSEQAGFVIDGDHGGTAEFRVVQLTPSGSACSIMVGTGISDAAPGSTRGLHLVVDDIVAAVAELSSRDVPVTAPRHMTAQGWVEGPDPQRSDYNSFAEFADPDGNVWVLQEKGHGG